MKRVFIFVAMFLLAGMSFAAEVSKHLTDDQLDYAEIVNSIDSVGAPYIKGDYAVFDGLKLEVE